MWSPYKGVAHYGRLFLYANPPVGSDVQCHITGIMCNKADKRQPNVNQTAVKWQPYPTQMCEYGFVEGTDFCTKMYESTGRYAQLGDTLRHFKFSKNRSMSSDFITVLHFSK